jgi:hypothetical protein
VLKTRGIVEDFFHRRRAEQWIEQGHPVFEFRAC